MKFKLNKNELENHNTDILCFTCIHRMAQYTSGEFDCSLYGRVKNTKICGTYIKNKIAS